MTSASPNDTRRERFLRIENVGMSFPTKKGTFVALRDINLDVARGEFIALIGHSGCGKSTLLNLVAGLTTPTSGVLLLDDRELKGPGPERAVVFQNHSLLPWMTCLENVYLAVERVFGATENKAKLRERSLAALELVNLSHAKDKRPGDAILEIMAAWPERELTVLCGHTHGAGECQPLPNVRILTGGAEYGNPAITKLLDL